MKTTREVITELSKKVEEIRLATEPKSAYGDQVFSSLDVLKSAATKLIKPENYSVLTDGKKFMLTTNRRAGIFAKEGMWKIIGSILPDKKYRALSKDLKLKRVDYSGKNWSVYATPESARLNIDVDNYSAGWISDANNFNRFILWEGGKQRATLNYVSGNVANVAKDMHALADQKTYYGNVKELTAQEYIKALTAYAKARKEAGTKLT